MIVIGHSLTSLCMCNKFVKIKLGKLIQSILQMIKTEKNFINET